MAVVGSPVVGELPRTGIFREAEVEQSMALDEFLRDADECHQDRFVVVCFRLLLSLGPLLLFQRWREGWGVF